ncbi:MBL fold metallo-hydrolase [Desulfovibrio sp. TomC]|uniref:MBL fold metallo-hydrolase n=1 Tax=Desulfovibrio sp. TomC TaxID=1562888 RepID=UPI000573BE4F|nr:MBL fold metallo-hydrolase [Desulfovibrio sp. TomC]KHK01728.1 putative hydrolase [Desulfovibrio sp. TomC]
MHSHKGFGPKMLRRTLLKGMGALALAPLMTGLGAKNVLASQPNDKPKIGKGSHNTRLVLLGTTGGMTWWPGSSRASNSQALLVGDAMYIIDLGFGSCARLAEAFNFGHFITIGGQRTQLELSTYLSNMRAVFFTHLHMDHLGDYPTFLEIGARAGYAEKQPLVIIGPGDRGRLDDNLSGYKGTVIQAESCNPPFTTPTPGTKMMTSHILQAFAQTFNDCAQDEGYPDIPKIIDVKEIGDPTTIPWPSSFVIPDPNKPWTSNITCPSMDPFEIYKDDRLRVTAILVDHFEVYPAFAFRFDTEDGSLVISGDTGPDTRGNLQKLAKGADVLVHEVIDDFWIKASFKGVKKGEPAWPLYHHVITAHTSTADVGRVAQQCSVKTLVLSHIAPANAPVARLRLAQENFSGKLIVGEDLMEIGIGKPLGRSKA